MDLTGKRALVTGGTRGIGKAIVDKFSELGAARVFFTGTQPSSGSSANQDYLQANFADDKSLADFTEAVTGLELDILVNNAGITKVGSFEEITDQDFALVDKVNVRAPIALCRAVLPHMRKQNWGRVVNISSIFGIVARDKRSPYVMSKFALDGFSAALATEVAADGILINCVCPGFIDTELTRSVLSPAEQEQLVSRVPAKRLGKPEEVANLVAFLASESNSFITAQSIAIDGGYTRV